MGSSGVMSAFLHKDGGFASRLPKEPLSSIVTCGSVRLPGLRNDKV